jgi:aspartate/methionine/tyrosine aminotransferase
MPGLWRTAVTVATMTVALAACGGRREARRGSQVARRVAQDAAAATKSLHSFRLDGRRQRRTGPRPQRLRAAGSSSNNRPVDVRPFRIERYYARYEFTTRYMLSSSDCESRTIADLLELEPDARERLLQTWCGYTESPGAPELRQAIAALYERIDLDEVIVTSCAEEGIFLLYHALLGAGDHAVVETPCYESALELVRSTGAEASRWHRRYEDGWAHDLEELERVLRPDTRVLYINQPHNPTGTLMDRTTLERVAELAAERGIVLFGDEVYRELEHDPADRLPAACDLDVGAVSLGSISKSYGLPGLRLGWLVTRDAPLREAIMRVKDYTTICSSAPSEVLTGLALRNRHVLLDRNFGIVQRNLPRLEEFFERHAEKFDWIRPVAGPIGFPRLRGVGDVEGFCESALVGAPA